LALLLPGIAWGDVGYNPRVLGQTVAKWYVKDGAGRLVPKSAVINFLAVPSTLHGAAAAREFERRWGAGSFSRFRWQGPDNELTATVKAALEWACEARPDLLGWQGGRPPGVDCNASAVEVLDACATGHGGLLGAEYGRAIGWPGSSPDKPIQVKDPSRPPGPYSARNPYWPMTMHYLNTAGTVRPPEPIRPPECPACPPVFIPEMPEVYFCGRVSYAPGTASTGRLDLVLLREGEDGCAPRKGVR
jgi:hypothetical protein